MVAAVAPGSPFRTRELCESHQVPFRCLADPDREVYRAFDLQRGSIAQIMRPEVIAKSMASLFRGNFGPPGGDIFQLGGSFVIDKDGLIRLSHAAADPSDLLPVSTILANL